MPGYHGRIVRVDLTTRTVETLAIEASVYEQFLGGYGLGARLLFDAQPAHMDPLGSDNHLMFAAGPLVGTPALMAARYTIMGKSPLTGTWGDANSGGDFGPMLKFSGFDGILIRGAAGTPVYLWVEDGHAELRDASHLWGHDTPATIEAIRGETHPEAEVACIGPAGEKRSLISCIIGTGGRAAGRSGLGAVMGSKCLKAVAVHGTSGIPIADPTRLQQLRERYLRQLAGPFVESLRDFGTCAITEEAIRYGATPIKNWRGNPMFDFPEAERLSGEALVRHQVERDGCYGCPIQCGGKVQVGSLRTRKPEHETLGAFGPLCANSDLDAIIRANALCDRYGLDTISTGSAIAFAMECYEQGILDATQTHGIELTWGNANAIVQLTEQIGKREGLGALLADGVRKASERLGKAAEAFAIHIHGQEPAMHDPKFLPGYAASYQLDATPGRHTQGGAAMAEAMPPEGLDVPPLRRHVYHGKGWWHRRMSNLVHVVNAAGLCLFGTTCLPVQAIPDFLNAVMGTSYTLEDIDQMGERIANMRHAFNLREGVHAVHFRLPKRLLQGLTYAETGWSEVRIDLDVQVEEILHAMDWDPQTGMPSYRKLEALGLTDVADALGIRQTPLSQTA